MSSSTLKRNTLIGLAASILLAGGKFAAGIFGHSSALVADAVESLADSVGSVIVWRGFVVASREPDDDHPYGYGRAETVAALSVGVLLVIAAGVIVVKAFRDLLTPHEAPKAWTLVVLLAVIIVKEGLFRLVLSGAEMFESAAARADAWHHRSDAITSAAAVIGVAIAIWGPRFLGVPQLVLADEVAAIAASGLILFTGIRLARPSLAELLDKRASEIDGQIRKTATSVEGVRQVEKLHARKSGRGYLVDLHLHVDPAIDVRTAHAIGGRVKDAILKAHSSVRHVLIHVEPDERGTTGGGDAKDMN